MHNCRSARLKGTLHRAAFHFFEIEVCLHSFNECYALFPVFIRLCSFCVPEEVVVVVAVVVDDHASHCVSLRLPCLVTVLTCQSKSPLVRCCCCCCLAALLPLSLIAPAVVEAVVLVLVHFSLRLSIFAQQPPCLQLCTDCRLLQRAHICRAGDTFPATQCRPPDGHI